MLKTFLSSLIVLIGFSSKYLTQNNPRSNNEGLEKKIKTPNNKTLSAGINIFSFIKPSLFYSRSPDSFFSSNLTVNVFLQKELTSCFALRIPVRVGLELPNRIISMGQNDFFIRREK